MTTVAKQKVSKRKRCRATNNTHIADKNDLAPLTISSCEVGESVGSHGCGRGPTVSGTTGTARDSGARATAIATTEATTAAPETAPTSKASATAEASTKTPTAAETSTAAETAPHGVGEPVYADLEDATVPVVAIELLDCVTSIVRGFEDNNAGTLGSTVRSEVDIGPDDTASTSLFENLSVLTSYSPTPSHQVREAHLTSLSEQVLQILPSDSKRKLKEVSLATRLHSPKSQTNVGDVELSVVAATHVAAVPAAAAVPHPAAGTSLKTSTAGAADAAARSIKSWLGFPVLMVSVHIQTF